MLVTPVIFLHFFRTFAMYTLYVLCAFGFCNILIHCCITYSKISMQYITTEDVVGWPIHKLVLRVSCIYTMSAKNSPFYNWVLTFHWFWYFMMFTVWRLLAADCLYVYLICQHKVVYDVRADWRVTDVPLPSYMLVVSLQVIKWWKNSSALTVMFTSTEIMSAVAYFQCHEMVAILNKKKWSEVEVFMCNH